MKKIAEMQYKLWQCDVLKGTYGSEKGPTALVLVDKADGQPVLTATVNIPKEKLQPNEVIIKDWSENQGIYSALVQAKIISESKRTVPAGWCHGIVCDLLIT